MAIIQRVLLRVNGVDQHIDVDPSLGITDPYLAMNQNYLAYPATMGSAAHAIREFFRNNDLNYTVELHQYPSRDLIPEVIANNEAYGINQEFIAVESPLNAEIALQISIGETVLTTPSLDPEQLLSYLRMLRGDHADNAINLNGVALSIDVLVMYFQSGEFLGPAVDGVIPSGANQYQLATLMYRPGTQNLGNASRHQPSDARITIRVIPEDIDVTNCMSGSWVILEDWADRFVEDQDSYRITSANTAWVAGSSLEELAENNPNSWGYSMSIKGKTGTIVIPRTIPNTAQVPIAPIPRTMGNDTVYYINDLLPWTRVFDFDHGTVTDSDTTWTIN